MQGPQEMSLHRNLNELIRIRKQEPELASIARWEKQGKKYNRRWDGYTWVPNSEWRLPEASEAGVGDQGLGVGGPGEVAGGEERVAGGGWRVEERVV